MVEAWHKRGHERQELLNGLMREAHEQQEDREDEVYLFKLAATILDYLHQRKEQAPLRHMRTSEFFSERVLLAISEFARTQEEADYLFSEFLKKVFESTQISFSAALTAQEQNHPQLVFHAPSAMTQVPLGEGD